MSLWVSYDEAAQWLGLDRRTISFHARAGRLTTRVKPGPKKPGRPPFEVKQEDIISLRDWLAERKSPSFTQEPTLFDIVYLAGLFDGEGYVGIKRRSYKGRPCTHQVEMNIANTNKDVLIRLQSVYGGHVLPVNRVTDRHRACWTWGTASRKAYRVLCLIEPFALIKREQIRLAIQFQDRIDSLNLPWRGSVPAEEIQWREEQMQRLKELKRLT